MSGHCFLEEVFHRDNIKSHFVTILNLTIKISFAWAQPTACKHNTRKTLSNRNAIYNLK